MSFFKRLKRIVEGSTSSTDPATDSEAIFSLSSAHITMETKLGLSFTGKSAICLKNVSGMQFEETKSEVEGFLNISRSDSGLRHRTVTDSYGYLWIIIEGEKIEDLLAASIAIGDTLAERGFSPQLLACVFEFSDSAAASYDEKKGHKYLIYNYKRNNFYAFVPLAGKKMRDTEYEMKMMAALTNEMPFERDITLWYPLWGLPF